MAAALQSTDERATRKEQCYNKASAQVEAGATKERKTSDGFLVISSSVSELLAELEKCDTCSSTCIRTTNPRMSKSARNLNNNVDFIVIL